MEMLFYGGIVLITISSLLLFIRSMHMFQLNMYKNAVHFKWLINNALLAVIPTKAKKPLVYTPRVIRMCISTGIIYGLIVFLLVYYETDVILFLVLTLLSSFLPIIANIINTPIEKLNNLRYINDAKRIINSHKNLITIGITGSYGKTSTKFFLQKLLSVKYDTLMTPESFNTTMGVVKTIRNDLKPTHEIFICEMGLMWKGDIKELCEIAKPKHSVLTSIGPQHLETMKTQENITAEKFEIVNCISDGMVFLNYDNEFIINHDVSGKNVIRYGLIKGNKDYLAENLSVSEKGTSFTVNGVNFTTRLLGAHNVQNITGAIAVAHKMGIELKDLVQPVKRLEPVAHRLEIINKGNSVIIDDAFNSNPVGARAALDVLRMFDGTRFLVTPGMVALGEKEYELNKEFGAYAHNCCDFAVLIGEKQAVPIKAGLLENNFDENKIKIFKTINEGLEYINSMESEKQKIILLENDLPDNY
jgi:UDP-N-acetylmuramoyl-tripeptide--D-alanyl-D-alanine ligase